MRVYRTSSSSTSQGACADNFGLVTLYYIGSGDDVEDGDVVYSDSAGTTPYDGVSNFWHVQNNDLIGSFAIRIGTFGDTSDKIACT